MVHRSHSLSIHRLRLPRQEHGDLIPSLLSKLSLSPSSRSLGLLVAALEAREEAEAASDWTVWAGGEAVVGRMKADLLRAEGED